MAILSAPKALAQAKKPIQVFAAVAQQSELVDRIEALGTLRANESVAITAQVTETITKLHFEDGQRVARGDVLADMSRSEEVAQLEEAKARLREAREQLDRAVPLARRGVSSDAVLSERRRDADTAAAQLKAVESRISDRRITAPFAGVVGLRRISVGALVEPGTVITTIDDDSEMKLDFTIPSTFLSSMRTGLPIVARAQAYGDQTFRGVVTGIDSRVDPITRSITVRAVLPNPTGALKAGVLMTLEVLKNRRQGVVVPEDAIVSFGRDNFVFVVGAAGAGTSTPTQAERRPVGLGARQAGEVEITSGLEAGEVVVTDGNAKLRPGSSVEVKAVEQDGNEPLAKLLQKGLGKEGAVKEGQVKGGLAKKGLAKAGLEKDGQVKQAASNRPPQG
ncbi:MAG: efflux RND transporter periplasmic adaptor subunit [Pseudomonadota bacterium]